MQQIINIPPNNPPPFGQRSTNHTINLDGADTLPRRRPAIAVAIESSASGGGVRYYYVVIIIMNDNDSNHNNNNDYCYYVIIIIIMMMMIITVIVIRNSSNPPTDFHRFLFLWFLLVWAGVHRFSPALTDFSFQPTSAASPGDRRSIESKI